MASQMTSLNISQAWGSLSPNKSSVGAAYSSSAIGDSGPVVDPNSGQCDSFNFAPLEDPETDAVTFLSARAQPREEPRSNGKSKTKKRRSGLRSLSKAALILGSLTDRLLLSVPSLSTHIGILLNKHKNPESSPSSIFSSSPLSSNSCTNAQGQENPDEVNWYELNRQSDEEDLIFQGQIGEAVHLFDTNIAVDASETTLSQTQHTYMGYRRWRTVSNTAPGVDENNSLFDSQENQSWDSENFTARQAWPRNPLQDQRLQAERRVWWNLPTPSLDLKKAKE